MQRKYGQIADDCVRSAKLAESTLAKLQLPLYDRTVVELARALQELMDIDDLSSFLSAKDR